MSLRIAILTSNASGNAARIAHHLARARPGGVEIAGAVVDRGSRADRRRQLARLRAWRRHGGLSYVAWRLWLELSSRLAPAPRSRYRLSLHELGRELGFPVIDVPNVNSPEAERFLRECAPDLALSLGNRVLAERIFALPRLGTVNLHHGRIPEYRGGPPAFWELYRGESSLGVSVHRVDAAIDHGELLAAAEVTVLPDDDPMTLMERAHRVDFELVDTVLRNLAAGTFRPLPVDHSRGTVNTIPSRAEVRELARRLGRPVRHDGARLAALDEIDLEPAGRPSRPTSNLRNRP